MGQPGKVQYPSHDPAYRRAFRAANYESMRTKEKESEARNRPKRSAQQRVRAANNRAQGKYPPSKNPANRRAARDVKRGGPKPAPIGRALSNFKSYLKSRYGMTVEQYDAMYAAQGGVCAVCRRPEQAQGGNGAKGPRRLSVDHCHDTNRVRALLCHACNVTVGMLTAVQLRACADYLDGWAQGGQRA